MDTSQEGILLIGTSMVLLVVFLLAVVAVMVIYQKRRSQHSLEIKTINEKFNQELLQTKLETQQQMMQHIGREIHDNVGQKLTLTALYVHQLANELAGTPRRLQAISTMIDESLTDLRNLSKDLTGENYKNSSLQDLMNKECSRVEAAGACDVKMRWDATPFFITDAGKIFILRIFQEFLNNSLKHAACTRIEVHIGTGDNGVQVIVRDNGRGFDVTAVSKGSGINNMKKRAAIIGAGLELTGAPGIGTFMILTLPNK